MQPIARHGVCALLHPSLPLLVATCLSLAGDVRAAPANPPEPVSLYYNLRPPFYFSEGDTVSGVRAAPLTEIFRLAEQPHVWVQLPVNRILKQLKSPQGAHCTGGWYRAPDREMYAWFSTPYAHNDHAYAITNFTATLQPGPVLPQLLSKSGIRVIRKQGHRSAPHIEAAYAATGITPVYATDENSELVRQLALGRADFLVLNQPEAEYLYEQFRPTAPQLRIYSIQDGYPPLPLHIMCNAAVPEAVQQRIDAGIRAYLSMHPLKP